RQPPITVASLRLFLRSSTGPNRRFQPQSLGRVRDPVRIAEGPTSIDAATQRRHFGFRLRLVDNWTKRLRRGMGGAGWVVAQDGRDLTVERVGCDTLGFPAVVAGDLWPPRTKGYHDVRTEKPSDPGHAARRAGRRDPTRVSPRRSPTGRLLPGLARSAQRAERRGLPPLRPR